MKQRFYVSRGEYVVHTTWVEAEGEKEAINKAKNDDTLYWKDRTGEGYGEDDTLFQIEDVEEIEEEEPPVKQTV